jgi:protein SCO1
MSSASIAQIPRNFAARTSSFLSGGSFPAFAIMALFFYQIFVAVMAFSPPATGVWGEFLEDFRLRCFKFSDRGMEMGSVWVMLSEPFPLQFIFFFIWFAPLKKLWRSRPRTILPLAGSALLLVGLIGVSLLGLGRAQAVKGELPFPADRLRSALPMPAFTLTDQDGETVSLSDLKGKVVLMTAVYSTCTKTCPMVLKKVRTVLDQLTPAELKELVVVAFSLSPTADTQEMRKAIARVYNMDAEGFHFVNGIPADVNALLDKLNVAREVNEESGEIMHSNLFFLLDREGQIAYRLSLSQNEQSWLTSALRVLLGEKPASEK